MPQTRFRNSSMAARPGLPPVPVGIFLPTPQPMPMTGPAADTSTAEHTGWCGVPPRDVARLIAAYTAAGDLVGDLDGHPTIAHAAHYLDRCPVILSADSEHPGESAAPKAWLLDSRPHPALILAALPRTDDDSDDLHGTTRAMHIWRTLLRPSGYLLVALTPTNPGVSNRATVIAAARTAGLSWQQEFLVVRLSFDLVEGGAAALDLGDDVFGRRFPDERLGVGVPVLGPDRDGLGEICDAGETSPPQPLVGQLLEPPLDQVQPRTRRRCEMQVPATAVLVCQPLGHLRCAVRGQVVQHDMHTQPARYGRVDLLEEPQHVATLVGLAEVGEYLPGREVHRREQVDRAVALVVVGHRAGASRLERQRRLRPVQGLALGLLVEAEHRRPYRRVLRADPRDGRPVVRP